MKALKLTSILALAGLAATAQAKTFSDVQAEAKVQLDSALQELADLRKQIANEKIPISKELTRLESQVLIKRSESESIRKSVEDRDVSLQSLQASVKARNDQNVYLKNTLNAYSKQFETRINIAEIQHYKDLIVKAQDIMEAPVSDAEKLSVQLELLKTSLARIKTVMGGKLLEGDALGKGGRQVKGNYVLAGPFAYFGDGSENTGFIQGEVSNINFPAITDRGVPSEVLEAIRGITASGAGQLPLDATMGQAMKLALTKETLVEHIIKGGITMIPLLGMAFVAVLIALFKVFEINSVKSPKAGTLQRILDALNSGNKQAAHEAATSVDGPFGDLLVAGVEHADQEKELLEEVLYERLLAAQPKLERFIAYIALTAAAAPLLGLLGTVTGMIQTFKAITVFGTGDPATLSDGISVALITTEYGLIVAIPALLAQALLTRLAKGKLGEMEQAAVAFVNGLKSKD